MKPSVWMEILFALVWTLQLSTSVDSTSCFRCLSLDCAREDMECDSIKSFVQSELKNLYYFGNNLDPCPSLSDTVSWTSMQNEDQSCPAKKKSDATCTLGQIEIKTTETDPNGRSEVRFNYATVLGCATLELLIRIKEAYEERRGCDLIKRNHSSSGVVRELEIEHCREIRSICYEKNLCVPWRESVEKPWPNSSKNNKFELYSVYGIIVVVVIVVITITFLM